VYWNCRRAFCGRRHDRLQHGACCASDADNGDEGRVEDLDEDTKAKAQEKLDKDNEYEPSGSGRIPGSKYTISEVDVLGGVDTCGLETWREVA
jgi:hypothetical protein